MAANSWSSIRILIFEGSAGYVSGKKSFYLISQQPDIDKIYLHTKHPYKAEYQYLFNKQESTDLKHFNDSKAFVEYSNDMYDIYKNIEEYNPNESRKLLIAFNDRIADMISNKKLDSAVDELFIRGRKLNISFIFIT